MNQYETPILWAECETAAPTPVCSTAQHTSRCATTWIGG